MDQLPRWRSLIGQHLGRTFTKRTRQVMLDLKSVDYCLKPAVLLDFTISSVKHVDCLLNALRNAGLLTQHLRVVTIGLDLLIINPAAFCCADAEDAFSSYTFVDVSASREHPQTISGKCNDLHPTRNCFGHFLAEKDSRSCIDLPLGDGDNGIGANPSTLFGVLLGYPVVYYYSMAGQSSQANCLSMVPLVHFVVSGETIPPSDPAYHAVNHTVFSFSVPEMLGDLTEAVEAWFVRKRDSGVWCGVFRELKLEKSVVQLPSVCM